MYDDKFLKKYVKKNVKNVLSDKEITDSLKKEARKLFTSSSSFLLLS